MARNEKRFEKLISYSMKILMEKEYSNVILTEN